MRYIRILLLLALIFFLYIPTASAHLMGQASFFTINGKYTNLYPVQSTSISSFEMPQDIAPENYVVNTELIMELDPSRIGVPIEIINKSTFDWDFGDGSPHGSGLKNTHIYKKIGSYVSKVYVNSPDVPEPQLLQSEMIHILPNSSYNLPVSKIVVNGIVSKNPMNDILKDNFSEDILFDGSQSTALSSHIASFYWDFGDEQSSSKSTVTHKLPIKYYLAFPVLRITDANGFISDSYVQINNDKSIHNTKTIKNTSQKTTIIILVSGISVLIIGFFLLLYFLKRG